MKGSKILKAFIVILISVFAIHQIASSVYKPIKTESASFSTVADGLDVTGLVIRNETLVRYSSGGVMHFITGDGSRAPKDGVIANIYDSETASITLSRIDSVSKKIADLEEMLSYNDLEAADLDVINNKVKQSLNKLVVSGADSNFEKISDCTENLLSSLNRRQAALGETADFSQQLSALKTELSGLSSSLPAPKDTVKAEISGYFVSKADGYENILKCDSLDSITPEYLKGIKPEEVGSDVVGKLVSDYEWYIAATVPINDSLNYKEGDELTIYTSVKSFPKLPATVKKINISSDSSSAVVLFSCNDMNSELASVRSAPMTIVKKEYSGLKIPKSALRVVDSKRGVYVLTGMQVKFVEVNIIYSADNYMLCEKQTDDEKSLRLYDDVIVKGRNLYDGKIVS